jgi:hypothetical protein
LQDASPAALLDLGKLQGSNQDVIVQVLAHGAPLGSTSESR